MKNLRVITLILTIAMFIAAIATPLGIFNPNYAVFALFFMGVCTAIFIIFQQTSEQKGNWIKPSNILLIGILGTCFQAFADILAGYKSINDYLLTSSKVLNLSAIISCLALISFCLGYVMVSKPKRDTQSVMNIHPSNRIYIRQNYIIVIIQSLAFLAWFVHINVADFLSGAVYYTSNDVLESNYYELFFQTTLYAELVLVIVNGKKQSYRDKSIRNFLSQIPLITLIITGIYLLLRLVSGDRGPVIYTLCAYLYTYISLSHKKFSLATVVSAVVGAALVITLIGIFRTAGTDKSISDKFAYAWEKYTDKNSKDQSVFPPTKELTISFSCNQAAINSIQSENEPYHYGTYQIAHILNIIPFVPSLIQNTLGVSKENVSSSYYVTSKVLGKYSSWSLGTSSVADYYLDGGALGVLIGFFILGLCFRKFDQWIYYSYTGHYPTLVYTILIVCVAHAIYIPRSSFLHELKPISLILMIFAIYYLLTGKFKRT